MRIYTCKPVLYFFSLLLLLLTISGCGSKRHLKQALELENSGLFQDAADSYMRALSSNRNNVDARLGLMRTGQLMVDTKLRDFMAFHRNNQHAEAVNAFMEVEAYRARVANLGVRLDIDSDYQVFFNDSKESHLEDLYQDGLRAIDLENFSSARSIFQEILSIDNRYKDAADHLKTATFEPVYRDGLELMANGLYRSAYNTFHSIITRTGNYKNALQLREEALKEAMMHITVIPFMAVEREHRPKARELQTKTIGSINRLESPFYRLINEPALASAFQNQNFSDPLLAIDYINRRGITINTDYILLGRITRMSEQTSPVRRTTQRAYLQHSREVENEDGTTEKITEYSKTSYTKIERRSIANLGIEFSLVNFKTGEILISESISLEERDQIEYGDFSGNHKHLVPGTWRDADKDHESDRVETGSRAIRSLQELFEARKEIKPGTALLEELLNSSASTIAREIERYNPEN
ncbi:hypothetical protein [Alkalitalea saponilacus]|uniref:Curli production assembly/transport component CsgG n=1 Tax=Alkalitalea saponilacus TaxID=889453 RepID=A0A1T5CK33_9BACT|nr:hypothetical protein [Alkalitalea saponilacus]ASB49893.1 hypothetical protein CDL62_12475 [Alkalitalea saponilacus]SKB59809.1 hypothetical protein SAMN03080601_00851 [Alkalitalea saponilacus]